MTKDEVKQLDDRGMAAWNNHDPDAFLSLLADDFVWYDWSNDKAIRDKDEAREYFNSWMRAFPDFHAQLVSQVLGEDGVAGEYELDATNGGPIELGGKTVPATQKKVHLHGGYMAVVRDGRIAEFRTHPDIAGMMMQLGLTPIVH
ncbi:MAG TPA: nuclear transport factor 2 family protein [Devosiaceae bacterium]|nr:nuclear transport factor 2 family protein [Devosiaceae bacterium]